MEVIIRKNEPRPLIETVFLGYFATDSLTTLYAEYSGVLTLQISADSEEQLAGIKDAVLDAAEDLPFDGQYERIMAHWKLDE